jgi:hypothetical protein
MDSLEVQERFHALPMWKATQQILGGKTFVNLFMQRCGLVWRNPTNEQGPPLGCRGVLG